MELICGSWDNNGNDHKYKLSYYIYMTGYPFLIYKIIINMNVDFTNKY